MIIIWLFFCFFFLFKGSLEMLCFSSMFLFLFLVSNNHESSWSTSTSTSDELSNNVNTKPFQTQISRSETLVTSTISSTKPSLSNSVWTDSKYSLSSEPIKKEDSVDKLLASKTESQLFPTPETKILTVNSQEPTKVLQVTVPVSTPSSPAVRLRLTLNRWN